MGNNGQEIERTGEQLDVRLGDVLFLHTIQREDLGCIQGPFLANDKAAEDIIPNAWSHESYFYWQVPFTWENTVYSIPVSQINENKNQVVEIKPRPQKFSESQGLFMKGFLKQQGMPIISPA